jgi:multiple sugar transport system substrate-binding protein
MFSTKKNIVRFGAVAVATIAVGALAGCSGASDAPAELSDGDVTISLAYWGGDARVAQTDQVIEAFEAKYPNITVQAEPADWTGYWDGLATRTAASDMPDVVQMDELYLASYADRGALADMGELDIDTANIEESALATGQVEGTQYAFPHGIATYALVANKDLFDEYGIELPDDETWTWDDFADLANELTEKSGGAVTGSDQIGGFDVGGKVTLDPAILAKMWQFQIDLQKSGGMNSAEAITESFNAGISGNDMATGKVGLAAAWNTQLTALTQASGANLVLLKAPEPEGVDPSSYKPSMFWSVASTSQHKAEAALFIDFLENSEESADIILTERGVPANDVIRASIADQLAPSDQAAIEYQDRVTPGAVAPLVTPNGASTIEAILQRYTQEVFAGQSSPEKAAEAFVNELQTEIDNAR